MRESWIFISGKKIEKNSRFWLNLLIMEWKDINLGVGSRPKITKDQREIS